MRTPEGVKACGEPIPPSSVPSKTRTERAAQVVDLRCCSGVTHSSDKKEAHRRTENIVRTEEVTVAGQQQGNQSREEQTKEQENKLDDNRRESQGTEHNNSAAPASVNV